MKFYEINQQLEALLDQVDPETGEALFDPDALAELLIARDEKLEGIALWIKNLRSDAAAIKTEKQTLEKRQKALENQADRLAEYLQFCLNGEKFKTARVAISYRHSKSVQIDDTALWENPSPEYIRQKAPEANKDAISAALKEGAEIPGCKLVESVSMQIK